MIKSHNLHTCTHTLIYSSLLYFCSIISLTRCNANTFSYLPPPHTGIFVCHYCQFLNPPPILSDLFGFSLFRDKDERCNLGNIDDISRILWWPHDGLVNSSGLCCSVLQCSVAQNCFYIRTMLTGQLHHQNAWTIGQVVSRQLVNNSQLQK